MSIKTVTLVGATGNLGGPVLDALAASGHFTLTVLQRQSSKSVPSQPVAVTRVSDAWDVPELTSALHGQDAVVACFPLRNTEDHLRLATAAAAAGVRRFIPADFGSVDARSARARELVGLFGRKVAVRERLEELVAARSGGGEFSWTSLVPGHFFDWGLREGFLHFDLKERKALILGDGNAKMSNSTLAQVGRAVVQVLLRPGETANRVLLIQSFCVSQNEILRSLEKATGAKWEVEHADLEKFVKEHKERADAGDKGSVENLVFALGVVEGNWEGHEDFAMDLLRLKNEDLDEVVKDVVASA
ncbi:Isoflavone reductase [Coniochaeta hoffmannii]|uniref:Isoflavone reductase n=1 Tax=Coniochaeta hoffmannii TaxID=91930 RepID=A0AA38VWW3_9PEZI|nr:Isoflavone reductase [Coniochaeta hoffmannii]